LVVGVAADEVGYSEILNIETEGEVFIVRHHHDWSAATRSQRYEMISTDLDPFGAGNDYAYIECVDKASERALFRRPCPALTHLWISPESRYVVGLSNVQAWNPYQLAIWDSTGTLLFKEHIEPTGACFSAAEFEDFAASHKSAADTLQTRLIHVRDSVFVDFLFMGAPDMLGNSAWSKLLANMCSSPYSSNFSMSVTNWVWWYYEENPDIRCIEEDGELVAISLLDNEGERITIPLNRVIR
jgi:hypothetical protein